MDSSTNLHQVYLIKPSIFILKGSKGYYKSKLTMLVSSIFVNDIYSDSMFEKKVRFHLAILANFILLVNSAVYAQIAPSWTNFVETQKNGTESILSDFSFSGYHFSEKEIPDVADYRYFNVLDYGAIPNDGKYDDEAIQATIDAAEATGDEAVVYFPEGKYRVSSDNDISKSIQINQSNIVLKGDGSGEQGTEIFMDKMRVQNGHWQFRFQPETYNTSTLTTISESTARGDYSVSVTSSSSLSEGQSIIIYHRSEEFSRAHYDNLELNETAWTRLFGSDGGLTVYECHVIESIDGNRVTFKNPIQVDLPELSTPYTIRNLKTIEGVGIEDIRFTSAWADFPREFVHHEDDTVDYGWNAVQFKLVQNSWIRNCEFKDWTQVADIRESVGVTVDDVLISGKRGHSSWITRRNYGVLVKDCADDANHHHGPGVGYSGVSTVYLRYKMSQNQSIDCHSGSPYATLFDDVDGGDFHTNGGPWVSYPHHGRYLTFWNFIHKKSENASYNFWSVDVRKPATYAEPFFIGFQPNYIVSLEGEGLDEMHGIEVKPKSLFEAQLALRLAAADTSTTSISESSISRERVKVYPNPFMDEIQVYLSKTVNIESVELISMDNKEIAISYTENSEGIVVQPEQNLAAGIYFVRLKRKGEYINIKVFKH